jgi:hypothetical protein
MNDKCTSSRPLKIRYGSFTVIQEGRGLKLSREGRTNDRMEIQYEFYSRVAQATYRSYECYEGWTLDKTNSLCYIQNPGGAATDYSTALACCNSLGAEILRYQRFTDAQSLLSLGTTQVWTDVHYDPITQLTWVDKNDNVAVGLTWDGGSPPAIVNFNCAATNGDYFQTDCTLPVDYVCQDSIPIVSAFDFHDQRGSSYFIASNPSDDFGPLNTGKVDVFWTRTENQVYDNIWDSGNSFTLYGYQAHEGFGASVSYLQDQVIDHQLFIGAVASYTAPVACNPSSTLNNGKVYVYHGEYTKWTASQILLAPTQFYEQSYFGKTIDSDRSLLHTLIVGCPGCNYTTSSGAIYVYGATPSASSWSQTQVLIPSSGNSHLATNRIRIHNKLIIGDSNSRVLVWRLLPHLYSDEGLDEPDNIRISRELQALPPRWSQQQSLIPQTYSLSSFDVFDDTIVIGSTNVPLTINTNVGAVFVYYPNSPDFGYHPKKPTPMQWTVHQTLFPPSPANNLNFGKQVSIAADRMYILSGGSVGYLYARPTRAGYWSLQQTITHGATTIGTVLEGSTIYSLVNSLTYALEVHDQTDKWGCLIVSVEDQFGDGWDNAMLTVTTPEGSIQDEFHSTCDLTNPFQFRYCPSLGQRGKYSFRVPDAVKAKYHWEILWRVFLESTGEWITGTWDTIMDFEWDPSHLSFKTIHIHKPLPSNETCHPCPTRPTMKPTPTVRHLKGSSHTAHPTISPAPTLETTGGGSVWQYLLVDGATDDWYSPSHRSTRYYLSDIGGRRLISSGTLCPSDLATSKLCWEDVPDGEYVLRVGGALNSFSGTHTFKWCKAANPIPAQSQVIVRVTERDCHFLSFFSRSDICGTELDYDVIVEFELFILGVSGDLAETEASQLALALNSVFRGFVSCQIISVAPVESLGVHVVLHANFNHLSSGYEMTNAATLTSVEASMREQFSKSPYGIWSALLSSPSRSNLHQTTGVTFVSLEFIGTEHQPLHPSLIADEVTTFAPAETEVETEESTAPFFVSVTGGLVLLLTALLVSGMVVLRVTEQPQQRSGSTNGHFLLQDESGSSLLSSLELTPTLSDDPLISSTSKVKSTSPKSSKSSQKKHPSVPKSPMTSTKKTKKTKLLLGKENLDLTTVPCSAV